MLSLLPAAGVAPVLVLAVGNPSRGDDALGPLAACQLAADAIAGVEVLTDFQLQVEHALDLLGRRLVLFVDATVTGTGPFEIRDLAPAADVRHSTHSLSPAAVLDTFHRLAGTPPPPARLLAIRGYGFDLGAPLSAGAAANLAAALAAARPLLRGAGAPQAAARVPD
jgi:hydrogenase maturation protease